MRTLAPALLLLVASFAAAPAVAADMAVKAPPAIPMAPAASWTGFYLGVDAGARWSDPRVDVPNAVNQLGASLIPGDCSPNCVPGESFDGTAFRFGPYLGYQLQFAPQWVAGIEGDWAWAENKVTRNGMVYPGGGNPYFITGNVGDSFAVKTTWDASARGRLGYLITPSFLVYGTGGAAWIHLETDSSCGPASIASDTCNPIGAAPGTGTPFTIQNSHTMVGWTVGGGLEASLGRNWFARAEYRYTDYGHVSNTDTFGGGGAFLRIVSTTVHLNTQLVNFGLAYKFGN